MKKTVIFLAAILLSVSASHAILIRLHDAETYRERLLMYGFYNFEEKTNISDQLANQDLELEAIIQIAERAMNVYRGSFMCRRNCRMDTLPSTSSLLEVILIGCLWHQNIEEVQNILRSHGYRHVNL